jgi:hypothetical protein
MSGRREDAWWESAFGMWYIREVKEAMKRNNEGEKYSSAKGQRN